MEDKMQEETLLIVDDEQDLLAGLKGLHEPELDCRILTAGSAAEALATASREHVDVVLTDIRMPDVNGLELLEQLKKLDQQIAVLLMTAYGSIDLAVEALRKGAYDFITKPLDEDRLFYSLKNCLERQRLLKQTATLQEKIREKEELNNFVGSSPALQKVLNTIQLVAKTDMSVLITGESGTGKELAARTIHALSDRRDRQMIAVNCPAIPEAILESELFGYKKGAFTNASQDKKGLFEVAHKSTLFLDEIGDLPLLLQTKLLRVLQEKEIKPLGDNVTRKVDVRIVASTNQDLKSKMAKGEFREDLYFRLSELSIEMPPLRNMKDDIPILANHFLEIYKQQLKRPKKWLSSAAMTKLANAPWKGNVRELQNVIKRSILLSPNDEILPEDIQLESEETECLVKNLDEIISKPYKDAKSLIMKHFATKYLTTYLEKTRGNVTEAAKISGLERQSFQHLMRKYNIKSENFRK